MALDSTTTTGVACHKECVKNAQHTDNDKGIIDNGSTMDTNEKAHFEGMCDMPCDERAWTNSFCLFDSINLEHRVCLDSDVENAFFVEKDDEVRIFRPSKHHLHFHDL